MWKSLTRLIALLHAILDNQQELNRLLRELILIVAQRPSDVPMTPDVRIDQERQAPPSRPSSKLWPRSARIADETDVTQVTPHDRQVQILRQRQR